MKNFAAFLVAACLAHSCFAFEVQTCFGAASTECSDVSTLEIEDSRENCGGTSSADCGTWASSELAFKKAFSDWWEGGEVCNGDARKGAAKVVAYEIAQIWTSAAEDVECSDGRGFACGWSFANGETFAQSVAEAVAEAAAGASIDLGMNEDEAGADVADSFCFGDVRALAGGMVRAEKKAADDACPPGGDKQVYFDSFASMLEDVVADAFASAVSSVCGTEGVVAVSVCAGTGSVTVETITGGAGEFCVGSKKITLCNGKVEEECCTDMPTLMCIIDCENCSSPYRRVDVLGSTLFRSSDDVLCLCDIV